MSFNSPVRAGQVGGSGRTVPVAQGSARAAVRQKWEGQSRSQGLTLEAASKPLETSSSEQQSPAESGGSAPQRSMTQEPSFIRYGHKRFVQALQVWRAKRQMARAAGREPKIRIVREYLKPRGATSQPLPPGRAGVVQGRQALPRAPVSNVNMLQWEKFLDNASKKFFWKNSRTGVKLWKDPATATVQERNGVGSSRAADKQEHATSAPSAQNEVSSNMPPAAAALSEALAASTLSGKHVSDQQLLLLRDLALNRNRDAAADALSHFETVAGTPVRHSSRTGEVPSAAALREARLAYLSPQQRQAREAAAERAAQKAEMDAAATAAAASEAAAQQADEQRRARRAALLQRRAKQHQSQQSSQQPQQLKPVKPLPPHLRKGSEHTQWVKRWDPDHEAHYWENLGSGETKWAT